MLYGPGAARVLLPFEIAQRKNFRRGEIADTVLVVDRERLNRLAPDRRRTAAGLGETAPSGGCFVEAAATAKRLRQRARRLDANRVVCARRRT